MTSLGQSDKSTPEKTPLKIRLNSASKFNTSAAKASCSKQTQRQILHSKLQENFVNPWSCDGGDACNAKSSLEIIHHTPQYKPPYYFDKTLCKMTRREQITQIMAYHIELHAQLTSFQQTQPPVVLGDPIKQIRSQCNGRYRGKQGSSGDASGHEENEYISRSGRHVRRRADLSGCDLSDEEETRTVKRIKPDCIDESADSPPSAIKKSQHRKQDSEDVRLKLLKHSTLSSTSNRSVIINKLAMIEQKKRDDKKELNTIFERSLDISSDSDVDTTIHANNSSLVDDDYDDPKILNTPSTSKKSKTELFSSTPIDYDKTRISDRSSNDHHASDKYSASTSSYTSPIVSTPNRFGVKKKTTSCPICGVCYPNKEIEQHASTCGLTSELEIESSIPIQNLEQVIP